jgi:hypothetical protein
MPRNHLKNTNVKRIVIQRHQKYTRILKSSGAQNTHDCIRRGQDPLKVSGSPHSQRRNRLAYKPIGRGHNHRGKILGNLLDGSDNGSTQVTV